MARKENSCIGKMVQHVGKRKRGRPKRKREDCLKEDKKIKGLKEDDTQNGAL